MPPPRAFTLIELLVVVTIIALLLALLTPALDQAVYEAEMLRCQANLRGIAQGVTTYAAGNKRCYPARQFGEERPTNLGGKYITAGAYADTRPMLAPYMGLNMLVDPFCKPVDLAPESNDPDTYIYSSNALWFAWYFSVHDAGAGGTGVLAGTRDLAGMRRVGDRLAWTDPSGESYQFDVLAGDSQAVDLTIPFTQTSHYDREGAMANQVLQKSPGVTPGTYTYSWWIGSLAQSYTMDCNYAHADLSALRLNKLFYDKPNQKGDKRLVPVPERLHDADANLRNYLPVP